MTLLNEETSDKEKMYKHATCAALLFFSVSSTLCAQASKSFDGSYAYDTFVIPFAAESLKCVVSIALECGTGGLVKGSEFKVQRFLTFSIPAACYFVSNNCMFYIIRELGGVTFQVTNNLKILSTGLLMRLFLGRKLTWLQWKALIVLAVGCAVTQFKSRYALGRVHDRATSGATRLDGCHSKAENSNACGFPRDLHILQRFPLFSPVSPHQKTSILLAHKNIHTTTLSFFVVKGSDRPLN